jgi:hypothetical protein
MSGLTKREREVLNTTLSQEIYKLHLHYGKPAKHDDAPDRLQVLYRLRDKLCSGSDTKMTEPNYLQSRYKELMQRHRILLTNVYNVCVDDYDVAIHQDDTGRRFEIIKNTPRLRNQDIAILGTKGNIHLGYYTVGNTIILEKG